jgi:hypothetical protein
MTRRDLAWLRTRTRKQSGGSVMFVIATTLALMASMGVYALASSGEELKVSGYMRQSAQAHYLTEMSMGSTASFMDNNADALIRQAKGDLNQGGNDYRTKNCQSAIAGANGVSDLAQACKRFTSPEITGAWKEGNNPPKPLLPEFRPGSITTGLGANQQAQFWAELTNFVPLAPPPGFDVNFRMKFVKATVTTGGILVTLGNSTDPNNNNVVTSTVGRTPEMGRGRVIVGPFLN